jgi:bla regulator protein blaR1
MITLILSAALKGTLVLAAAWIASVAARKASSDLRHSIWLGALLAMAVLLIPVPVAEPSRFTALATGVAQSMDVGRGTTTGILWSRWALWIWAAGAGLLAMRYVAGLIGLASMTKRSQTLFGNVRMSDRTSTPLTWGVVRPEILLPAYALDWTEEKRDVAIRHEQAHIARRDWIWQTAGQVMTCVFWFHPLVWLAAAKLRDEAERATDDAVLNSGADAAGYAEQLVEVARRWQAPRLAVGVSMVRTPVLENRVHAILDPKISRGRAGLRARLGLAAAALAMIAPLAAFQDQVHKMDEGGMTAPKVLSMIQPDYTQEAKDAKIQGTVRLSVEVDTDGRAKNITVTTPLGAGLDQNAIGAVAAWRFEPGKKDGVPVKVLATIEVNFRLQ